MDHLVELLAAVRSLDADIAEPAARTLRVFAERDAPVLLGKSKELLKLAMDASDLRVRWNLIQVVGKLALTGGQRGAALDWLFKRLEDASPLTRTFALQALMDLSEGDAGTRARLVPIAEDFLQNGTAAMRARARTLLKRPSQLR